MTPHPTTPGAVRRANGTPDHRDVGGNKAATRTLLVLSKFTDGRESAGVSELSRELGMTKNMVHRALTTLARYQFLVRDASGTRYQLGPGVLQLARTGLEPLNLPRVADPYLRQMQELSGETVSLAIPVGRMAVTIAGARGRGDVARRLPLGRSTALHASPASRAILAFLQDEEIESYLAEGQLERYTATTLVEPADIWREVRAVRARGYALSLDDHARGVNGVAFPVLANDGRPHGSVTVGGSKHRLTPERLEAMVPELENVMAELNRRSSLYAADAPMAPMARA